MDMLAQREHSRRELARKLHEKSNDFEMVELVLDRLESDNLLSNSRFTESFVRKQSEKGYGPNRILSELNERGIEPQVISLYLNKQNPKWLDLAHQVALQKIQQMGFDELGQLNEKDREKVTTYLENRGFAIELALECFTHEFGE